MSRFKFVCEGHWFKVKVTAAKRHQHTCEFRYHFKFLTFGHFGAQPWAPECPNVRNLKWSVRHLRCWTFEMYKHMVTLGFKRLSGRNYFPNWLEKLTAVSRYPCWAWWPLSRGQVKGWIRKRRKQRKGREKTQNRGSRLSPKITGLLLPEMRLSAGIVV